MKKILSAILLAVMLTAIFAGAAMAEVDKVFTHGSVNLRKTASIDAKILAVLEDGTECSVIESKKDNRDIKWYKVKANGKTGWISSVYANDEEDIGTVKGYLTATGNVNLRKTANGKPVLAVIKKGSTVAYFSSKTVNGLKWYLVRYKDTIGWACGDYLTGNGSTVKYHIYATDGDSYIRSDAKLTGKILGMLEKGEKADYLDASKKDSRGVTWYKVEFEGITGWVSSAFTTKKK